MKLSLLNNDSHTLMVCEAKIRNEYHKTFEKCCACVDCNLSGKLHHCLWFDCLKYTKALRDKLNVSHRLSYFYRLISCYHIKVRLLVSKAIKMSGNFGFKKKKFDLFMSVECCWTH